MTKVCNDCGIEKSISDFQKKGLGFQPYCRDCNNARQRKLSIINKDFNAARKKIHYSENKNLILEKNRIWRENNKDRIKNLGKKYRADNADKILLRNRAYRENNRERVNKYHNNYRKEKERTDLNYRIANKLRTRLNSAIKGGRKSGSAVSDLGCSIEELRTHLQKQFKLGMSWKNYGKGGWSIDHIIPLAYFDLTNREELLAACHYTNLQPLWEKENSSKGAKLL